MNIQEIEALASKIRIDALNMTHDAKSAHVGSCLSCADILAVLYGGVMNVKPDKPDWPERDRFILSKGHACAALYAVLAERGFFPKEWLKNFYNGGSFLTGHTNHNVPGVDVSTGSLGDGLSIGCGMALANPKSKVYVLMGDGDLNEGSTWEAALFAGHHKLSNLRIIVDCNGLQALGKTNDILNMKSLLSKWRSFGWFAVNIDGHNLAQIFNFLAVPVISQSPMVAIAKTIKGKGVSFLENKTESHYKCLNNKELEQALEGI